MIDRFSAVSFGGLASIVGHLLVLVALVFAPAQKRLEIPLEDSLDVEIVTLPSESANIESPLPKLPDSPAVSPQPPEPGALSETVEVAKPKSGVRVKPTRMLAAAALADPRSRELREGLGKVTGDERVRQLCGVEALSQVAIWDSGYKPEQFNAYAFGAMRTAGRELIAEHAAFRSVGVWYAISIRCSLSADRSRVVAFEFTIGDPIPKNRWAAGNLTSGVNMHP